jgi:hypothetical protein
MATFKTFFGFNSVAGPTKYRLTATTGALALTGTTTNLAYDGPPTIVIGEVMGLSAGFGLAPSQFVAQTFISIGVSVTNIRGWLKKNNSPTDGVYVRLYTVDASHFPLTEIAVSANGIHSSSMTTSDLPFDFEFTPAVPVTIGVEYALVYERTGAISSTNYYFVAVDGTIPDPYPYGEYNYYSSLTGLWIKSTDYDVVSVITQEAAADGAYTLTATTGALALTGTSTALAYGRTWTVFPGGAYLTGTSVNLTPGGAPANYPLTATTGALALTGNTAALQRALILQATTAALALTGSATNLLRASVLAVTQGALALTGSTAGLLRGIVLSATSGALALTGSAANLLRASVLAVTQGALALTGNVVDLVRSNARTLTALTGELLLTGRPANLLYNRLLSVTKGTLTLAGSAASLTKTYILTSFPAFLALTGANAVLRPAYRVAAQLGQLLLTGRDAGFVVFVPQHYTLAVVPDGLVLYSARVELRIDEKQPGPMQWGRRLVVIPGRW